MSTLMLPAVGMIYKFTFRDGYNYHDGIYKVARILTYDEYIADGRDLKDDFFTPNNKTEDDFNEVYEEATTSKILKLISPDGLDTNTTEVYVPLNFLSETPDMNVDRYYKFGLVVEAGITRDPQTLTFMSDLLKEAVSASFGIDPKVTIVTLHEKWMSDSDYQKILRQRDESKLKVLNYYSENLKLEKRLAMANTQIKEYEKLILNLQHQLETIEATSNEEGDEG